jgi:hypothetical protein
MNWPIELIIRELLDNVKHGREELARIWTIRLVRAWRLQSK